MSKCLEDISKLETLLKKRRNQSKDFLQLQYKKFFEFFK